MLQWLLCDVWGVLHPLWNWRPKFTNSMNTITLQQNINIHLDKGSDLSVMWTCQKYFCKAFVELPSGPICADCLPLKLVLYTMSATSVHRPITQCQCYSVFVDDVWCHLRHKEVGVSSWTRAVPTHSKTWLSVMTEMVSTATIPVCEKGQHASTFSCPFWACDCSAPPSSHPWKDTNAMNIVIPQLLNAVNVISRTQTKNVFFYFHLQSCI